MQAVDHLASFLFFFFFSLLVSFLSLISSLFLNLFGIQIPVKIVVDSKPNYCNSMHLGLLRVSRSGGALVSHILRT